MICRMRVISSQTVLIRAASEMLIKQKQSGWTVTQRPDLSNL